MSTTVLFPATAPTRFSLATVTVIFGSFTETLFPETVTSASEDSLDTNCTTAVPCETKALVGLGNFSFISVPSTNTTNSSAWFPLPAVPAEPLIGRELIPDINASLLGEYVPCPVVIDHFVSVDLITSIEFFTLVSVTQNGHKEFDRASKDVRSMSPAPPVQALGSLAGSLPEKENFHFSSFRSTSTYRFFPGQFESYNWITA